MELITRITQRGGLFLLAISLWLCFAMGAQAQTVGSIVWETQGYGNSDAIETGSEFNNAGETLTLTWVMAEDGGVVAYSGDDYVSYGSGTRGGTTGNIEFGLDNDAFDLDDKLTMDFAFNNAVDDLEFTVLDIDENSWHDAVEVYYDTGSGWQNAALNTAVWTLGGNRVALDNETYMTGWEGINGNAGSSDASANIAFDFTGLSVTAFRLVYFSGDDISGNPGGQVGALSDVTFTVPAPALQDYSDAPLTGTSYGSAAHILVSGFQLGTTITQESGPYDSNDASADVDDGVTLPVFTEGQPNTIIVDVAGAAGFLQGWIDWNDNGNWNDAGEQIAVNLQDTDNDGTISIPVTPPPGSATSQTIARFRWSSIAGLNTTANASNGEVEDYALGIFVDPSSFICPAGFVSAAISGNANTIVTAATDSTRALGAISPIGSAAPSLSARIRSATPTLTLGFEHLVPEGAPITVSIARNNSNGNTSIRTSSDDTSYTEQATFNGGTEDSLTRVTITAPANGAQYMMFQRLGGGTYIDGISYNYACIEAPSAELQASKTVATWDPLNEGLFSIPGNDVIYTITAFNVGDGPADVDTIELIDKLPPEIEFWNGDLEAGSPNDLYPGNDPVSFQQTGAGLTFDYATDVRFGTGTTPPANFAACSTHAPTGTYRTDLTFICINPKGAMLSGDPDPTFSVHFRTKIK